MSHEIVLLISFVVISSLTVIIVYIFRYLWTKESKFKKGFIKIFLSTFTLAYLLLILECFFYFFVIQTDGTLVTLSAKRWLAKYWSPINSLGYRDTEHNVFQFENKKIIFVVGDSFVAGHGIKNYKKRFSNILQEKLGEDYVVINIAKCGWNTTDEYRAIASYPYKPDIIILSYLVNDIEGAATQNNFSYRLALTNRPNKIIMPLVKHSYLINFVYWRLCMQYSNLKNRNAYSNFLEKSYSNRQIWETQKKELLDIVNYAKEQNSELIIVCFPFMVGRSQIFISKVVNLMNYNKIKVFDSASYFIGRNSKELVVNQFDRHPNETVNKEIAEFLFEYIKGRNYH